MKKQFKIFVLILGGLWFSTSEAKIKVVTTLSSFASIAGQIGGEDVEVKALTKGNQDPHFVDAKPSLALSLNRADLLVRSGLGLEDGWLPPLIVSSRNDKINSGSDGDFDVSRVMRLQEVPSGKIDRTQGDVHPGGNPHYMLDPRNGIVFATALAERLAKLEPSKADAFKKRAAAYSSVLKTKIVGWEKSLSAVKGKPAVMYHKSWIYFSNWSGLEEVGFIEPKPGIPPSPDHIVRLVATMKSRKVKLILMEPYYPRSVGEDVAQQSGAQLLVLPTEVDAVPEAKDYVSLFDTIVNRILKASTAP